MVLISNNCLAGFIYRDILNTKYTSPFIWTGINPDDYINMIDEFDTLDLEDITINKECDGKSNNFDIILCEKYHIHNHHMWFNKNAKIPIHTNACDVSYCKIWEYIYDNWMRRATRAKSEKTKLFLFYDNYNICNNPYRLHDVMKTHINYQCIAFTDKDIEPLDNLIIKKIDISWGSEQGGWYNSFMKTHACFLKDYLTTH